MQKEATIVVFSPVLGEATSRFLPRFTPTKPTCPGPGFPLCQHIIQRVFVKPSARWKLGLVHVSFIEMGEGKEKECSHRRAHK